jgi:hypothetical protein
MATVWDRVRQLKGKTLKTLHRKKPFTVIDVLKDRVKVRPEGGNGTVRPLRGKVIEDFIDLGISREELRRRISDAHPDSRNTSYYAAIAYEVSRLLAASAAGASTP